MTMREGTPKFVRLSMIAIRILTGLLLLSFVSTSYAQTLMPPGGPQVCDANGLSWGQQSSVDVDARLIKVRGDGAAFQTNTSFATIRYSFQAVSSYPAQITLGITYSGLLSGGGIGNTIRGDISVVAELHDMTAGQMVGSSQVLLDESHNDLGLEVLASGLTPPSADFSENLIDGRDYEVRLRVEASGAGPGGESDFFSGLRGVEYSCLSVEADMADTDGDGIYDVWETVGVDIDNDGIPELPADQLGTDFAGNPITLDPNRKDILVELDYFDCSEAGSDCAVGTAHTHRPRIGVLADARDVFDSAPVSNPNGAADGISLWIIEDEALPHQEFCDIDDGCFDALKSAFFGRPGERADDQIIAAKSLIFRYNIWVHDKAEGNTSSGEADGSAGIAGDDFIVSLGSWPNGRGSYDQQLGTFIHELGHTLGLGHGGGDNENCKPNYFSVMSYTFQTVGIEPVLAPSNPVFDYSRTLDPASSGALVEDQLDEPSGVEGGPFISYYGPPVDLDGIDNPPNPDGDLTDDWLPIAGNAAADWDQDGDANDSPAAPSDINFMEIRGCDNDGANTPDAAPDDTLDGYVDWDILRFNFRDSPYFPVGEHGQSAVEELDYETAQEIAEKRWRSRPRRLYRYDAKLICGTQTRPGGLLLTQGRYASVINILNPGPRTARIRKSVELAYPPAEQLPGDTFFISIENLPPGHALKVDCEDVRTNVFDGHFPADVVDGFVSIQSSHRLDVQGVYTTGAVNADGEPSGHSSIEIERYAGHDLAADLRVAKRGAFVPWYDTGAYTIYAVLFEVIVTNHGASDAIDVTLHDEISVFSQGVVAVAMPLDDPIDLSAGATLDNLELAPDGGAELDFSLGDISPGSGRRVRFLVALPVYRLGGDVGAAVSLLNVARAETKSFEANPIDNDDQIIQEIIP